ncbi:MAG: hypothetical protein SGILL_008072 [Bacillariaceae sp.]
MEPLAQRQLLPFRKTTISGGGGGHRTPDRIKTTIFGETAAAASRLSPRSVCAIPTLEHLLQPSVGNENDGSNDYDSDYHHHQNHRHHRTTTTTILGAKRKFPFDASFSIFPSSREQQLKVAVTPPQQPTLEESASKRNTTTTVNLRHRLVCGEMVEWLATQASSSQTTSPVEKLWLGPVFDSPETVLNAISTLPPTVTHLDLDLRNALHLVPRAMPLLFGKRHIKTLSVRVFGDAGAMDLARWLHCNPSLQSLDLRGNRIGSLGARTIVDALIAACSGDSSNSNDHHALTQLNLSCNCILHGDLIGQLLAFSTTQLQSLDLGYNWLGDEEVEDICQGLRKNTSLRELNLFGCQRISHEGFRTLLDCIKNHNTSLHKVQLQAFDEEGRQLVREINYWLNLNKAGRYLMKSTVPVSEGLWPLVLSKSSKDADSLFYLIREAIGPTKKGQGKGKDTCKKKTKKN